VTAVLKSSFLDPTRQVLDRLAVAASAGVGHGLSVLHRNVRMTLSFHPEEADAAALDLDLRPVGGKILGPELMTA
jgi:hypothetical protein